MEHKEYKTTNIIRKRGDGRGYLVLPEDQVPDWFTENEYVDVTITRRNPRVKDDDLG